MRSPFIFAGLLISLVGFSIIISDASIQVKYFGTFFCVTGSYAAFPGVVAWYVTAATSDRLNEIIHAPGSETISLASTSAQSAWLFN